MNILDMFNSTGIKAEDNVISSKLAVKSEIRKIERRSDDIVGEIIDFIKCEVSFINDGCTYSCNNKPSISDADKKMLLKKLKESCYCLSDKIKSEIDDVFGDIDEKEQKELEKTSEIKIEPAPEANLPEPVATITRSAFGY